eukprot:TRINITY_DN17228_c0_g1_i3.p1 TRINITY_DN17228_c0_g1~~TRINITY_DN17228_c0_g1_i3.p1  ORF type:complete len:352 (-),score=40.75 TRINITY_DN17228_c0_g1_i3:141-1196(-)
MELRKVAVTIAVLLAALLLGVCYNAALRVQDNYEPFPSPEELAAQYSGKYFRQRPSDGGSLEYYEYGSQEATARVWFLIHGGVATGGHFKIFPDFDARMKELNVRVVAPTMPGWGASDAYGPLFEIIGDQWLEKWAQDSLALMDHLKIEKVAVSGLSLGGAPGLATAAAAQKQNRLVAVAPLIALMWSQPGFDVFTDGGYSTGTKIAMQALQNRYLGSLYSELVRWFVLRTDDAGFEANPMIPKDVQFDRLQWGRDMQHAVRYQLAGQVQSTFLPNVKSKPLLDWSVFDKAVPVYVFYGELDETVPPAVGTYTATKLPWAERRPFNGTHFHLDIFEVAATLFPREQITALA